MRTRDTSVIVDRILAGMESSTLFIDPIIEPGMQAAGVREAAEAAVARSEDEGVATFVALIPGRQEWISGEYEAIARSLDRFARESNPGSRTISIVAAFGALSQDWVGIVSEGDGGGADALDTTQLNEAERRVGLAETVAFAIARCLAVATGATPPETPSNAPFLERSEVEYLIQPGAPDAIVATTAFVTSAVGVAWLFTLRDRHGWKRVVTPVSSTMMDRAAEAWLDTGADMDLPKDPSQEQVDSFDRLALIDEATDILGSTLGLQGVSTPKDARATLDHGAVQDVVALAVLGRARAAARAQFRSREATRAPQVCFFHPLHPEATRERSWKTGRQRLTVPCCPECAATLEKKGDPRTLMVAGRRGKPTPYYASDSVYARTGYGAFRPLESAIVEEAAKRVRA